LERAERDGISKVAQDLGLTESMLYSWRSKHSQTSQPFEAKSANKLDWRLLNEKMLVLRKRRAF